MNLLLVLPLLIPLTTAAVSLLAWRSRVAQRRLGVVGAARPQRGLVFEPFLRDELVVIVPPGHHLADQEAVTLEDLLAEPMLLQQEGSGVRSVVEAAMRSRASGRPVATPHLLFSYEPRDFQACRESGATWRRITESTPEPAGLNPGGQGV